VVFAPPVSAASTDSPAVCVHRPYAAKNADVPLELLHLVVQRAPDDGALAKLGVLREHQSLERGAASLELLRASSHFSSARLEKPPRRRRSRRARSEPTPTQRSAPRASRAAPPAATAGTKPRRVLRRKREVSPPKPRRLSPDELDLLRRRRPEPSAALGRAPLRFGRLTLELACHVLQLRACFSAATRSASEFAPRSRASSPAARRYSDSARATLASARASASSAHRVSTRGSSAASVRLQRSRAHRRKPRRFLRVRVRLAGRGVALGGLRASLGGGERDETRASSAAVSSNRFSTRRVALLSARQVRRGVLRGVLESQRARFGLSHHDGRLSGAARADAASSRAARVARWLRRAPPRRALNQRTVRGSPFRVSRAFSVFVLLDRIRVSSRAARSRSSAHPSTYPSVRAIGFFEQQRRRSAPSPAAVCRNQIVRPLADAPPETSPSARRVSDASTFFFE